MGREEGGTGESVKGIWGGGGKGQQQNNIPLVSEMHEKIVKEHGCKMETSCTNVPAGVRVTGATTGPAKDEGPIVLYKLLES